MEIEKSISMKRPFLKIPTLVCSVIQHLIVLNNRKEKVKHFQNSQYIPVVLKDCVHAQTPRKLFLILGVFWWQISFTLSSLKNKFNFICKTLRTSSVFFEKLYCLFLVLLAIQIMKFTLENNNISVLPTRGLLRNEMYWTRYPFRMNWPTHLLCYWIISFIS